MATVALEKSGGLKGADHRLVAVFLLIAVVYFAIHLLLYYGKLDFAAKDLGQSNLSDFFVFYSGSRFLLDGGGLAGLYDIAGFKSFQEGLGAPAVGLHPFNYPPSYALFIYPLGYLSYPMALVVWQIVTVLFFALSLRLAGLKPLEVLAAVVAPVSVLNLSGGQNGFLTSALMIAGLAFLGRQSLISGIAFGLLTIKPHLGLLIPVICLARRAWLVIVVAAISVLALVGVSVAVFGLAAWPDFFDFLNQFRTLMAQQSGNSFLHFGAAPLMALQILGLPSVLAYSLQGLLTCFVLAAVYRAYRADLPDNLLLSLVLVGVSLAAPLIFFYDLPFLAVAVILFVRIGLEQGFQTMERPVLVFAWLLPFIGGNLNDLGLPLVPLVNLVLFVLILRRLKQAARAS